LASDQLLMLLVGLLAAFMLLLYVWTTERPRR